MSDANISPDLIERVQRYIKHRVRDPHAASDVVQDVMLKAYRNRHTAPDGEHLASWVLKIARNTLIDRYRTRRRDISLDQAGDVADETVSENAAGKLASCLRGMVERLPEPYREAVRLSQFEGLTQQALARRAGISLSGAKSRVQRGREKLKEMLLDCCRVELSAGGSVVDFERRARTQGHDPYGDLCT